MRSIGYKDIIRGCYPQAIADQILDPAEAELREATWLARHYLQGAGNVSSPGGWFDAGTEVLTRRMIAEAKVDGRAAPTWEPGLYDRLLAFLYTQFPGSMDAVTIRLAALPEVEKRRGGTGDRAVYCWEQFQRELPVAIGFPIFRLGRREAIGFSLAESLPRPIDAPLPPAVVDLDARWPDLEVVRRYREAHASTITERTQIAEEFRRGRFPSWEWWGLVADAVAPALSDAPRLPNGEVWKHAYLAHQQPTLIMYRDWDPDQHPGNYRTELCTVLTDCILHAAGSVLLDALKL